MTDKADVLICGGGIIGLTIARGLLRKGHENIVILEKEKSLGCLQNLLWRILWFINGS